jgi:outer membrane protein assembly factor BamB
MRVETLKQQPSSSSLIKYVKPVPSQIDDWRHYLYGADNNAVSRDARVGPPQRMQWVCGPAYARSHEINSSMAGMVSAGGRIFYIWDEGPLGQPEKRFPSQWSLIARDGFNGLPLWKLSMPDWGWRQWHAASRWDNPRNRAAMLRQLPRTTTRRLVATADRLYVTLGYEAPVSVLDAATGDLLSVMEGSDRTDEILLDSQTLILVVRDSERTAIGAGRDFRLSQNQGRVAAVDAQTGQRLWQSEPDTIAPLTLASHSGRVYYASQGQVVCLDGSNGKRLWMSATVQGNPATATLVAQEEVVLFACGPVSQAAEKRDYQTIRYHQAHAFSAETGERLWSSPQYRGPSGNARDVFVIGGLVWFGVDNKDNLPDHWRDTTTQRLGYDLLSGEVKRRVSVPKLTSPGHHYRCYRSKATERFLLLPKRGVEFLDLQGEDHMRHDWLRAPCTYGFMPANGMLYTAPHQCVCYQGVLLSNFTALTAKWESKSLRGEESEPETRLEKGPAYGRLSDLKPPTSSLKPSDDWPMYRHDPRRSGASDTAVPDRPQQRWEIGLKAPITPPVVAQGKLLVAEKDAHTIQALDARTGGRLWHFTAGARIDSPPTIHAPLALFGSSDGWLYCLDVSDGTEVWRFLAAPQQRQVGAYGQLESAWPVHGSVLVQNDVTVTPPRALAYSSAGRSTYLDGGIHVYALDPQTGEVCYQNRMSGPRPDPFVETGGAGYMDGAKSDILVSDGADLFLHQERFRSDLKRFPSPMQQLERERGGYREYPSYPERGSNALRLLSSRGFLDDSYNEGTYWAFSQRWPGWDRHMGKIGAYGQLLVFDRQTVFGVQVFTEVIRVRRGFFPGTKGYRLFAKAYEPGRSEDDFKKTKDDWTVHIPVRVRAMVLAGDKLFVAGPPDVIPDDDPLAAFEGRKGAELWAISATTGRKLAELPRLKAPPVYDGLIAAGACLYLSTIDGRIHCFGE